jgi:hypothetical protein
MSSDFRGSNTRNWTEDEIVADIRRVAGTLAKVQGEVFRETEYRDAEGELSRYFLFLDGRGWKFYCEKAGSLSA